MKIVSFVVLLVMLVLFTIFVTQNMNEVTVTAFMWNFMTSLSLLMVIIAVVGIILGLIIAALFERKRRAQAVAEDKTIHQLNDTRPDVE